MLPHDPKQLFTPKELVNQERVEINAAVWVDNKWTVTVSYFHNIYDQEPYKVETCPKNVACWLFPNIARKPNMDYVTTTQN